VARVGPKSASCCENQRDDFAGEALGKASATGPASLAGSESIGAVAPHDRTQSLHLAHAQAEGPRGLELCEPPLLQARNQCEPIQFGKAHRDGLGSHVGRLPKHPDTTFLRWRKRRLHVELTFEWRIRRCRVVLR